MILSKEKIFATILFASFLLFSGVIVLITSRSLVLAENKTNTDMKLENSQLNILDYDISEFFYFNQEGKSSWYGKKFHKRKTASGEVFNMNEFTAAHRTLPFGTIVRIRNLENNRTILVKINDRGPFVYSKVIDLSFIAAKTLGSLGNSKVELEALIPRSSDELDLSEQYFFGYSFEYPLICLPQSKLIFEKEFSNFDEALEYYSQITSDNVDNFYYIFVPVQLYDKSNSIATEKYYVGKINTGTNKLFVEKQNNP